MDPLTLRERKGDLEGAWPPKGGLSLWLEMSMDPVVDQRVS